MSSLRAKSNPFSSLTTQITEQVAALAYTQNDLQGAVVCIVSARSGGWTLPKGHIDPGHTPLQAASIEAYEEAGLIGEVHPDPIGSYEYVKTSGKRCRVEIYPMRITSVLLAWHEYPARERAWIEPIEAEHWIDNEQAATIVTEFSDALVRLIGQSRNRG